VTEHDTEPDLHLTLHEEGVRAVVSTIHIRTTVAAVLALLEQHGVVVGISGRRIRQAVRTARRSNRAAHDVVVAEGQRPRSASRQRLTYHLPPGLDGLPSLDPIHNVLALTQGEVQERVPHLLAWIVAPVTTWPRSKARKGQRVWMSRANPFRSRPHRRISPSTPSSRREQV